MALLPAQRSIYRSLLLLVISSLGALLIGCVSHEYRDLERSETAPIPYGFEVGETVQITTADGQGHEIEIESISNTGVTGDGTTIQFDDMRIVRVRSVDVVQTAGETSLLSYAAITLLLILVLVGV